ncbi:MAG: hypothetical protein M3P06_18005 [Acidobacteriota bacterium]|nr:hypothetical protein [Acidobacteriota bacterium]
MRDVRARAAARTEPGGDAWNRFRVPFFAAIAVVMLFFFTTQRQTFDATIALVGGLTGRQGCRPEAGLHQ